MPERDLLEQIKFLLITQGYAQLRSGERRSEKKARALLKKAADEVGISVTTKKGDNFVRADVKEG